MADSEASSTGLDANVAGLLSYALGIITGIVFLVIEKQSSFVRFHAAQSTFAFGGLIVIRVVAEFIPLLGSLIAALVGPVALVLWILLMVKAYQGERFKLPWVGDLAEGQSQPPG